VKTKAISPEQQWFCSRAAYPLNLRSERKLSLMSAVDPNDFLRQLASAPAPPVQTERVTIDGVTFIGRRVTMAAYIAAGRLPQRMASRLEAVENSDAPTTDASKWGLADLTSLGKFARMVIQDCVLSPRIIYEDRPLEPGEVHVSQVPQSWLDKVYDWALYGKLDAPIDLQEGQTSVGALETFRDNGARAEQPVGLEPDRADIQPKTKRVNRVKR
jgi:hypothetical protein